MDLNRLPVPSHYDPTSVDHIWRVPYAERAAEAQAWRRQHAITPAGQDSFRVSLVLVDVQNTFCIPGYELFVAGGSGMGAVEDSGRLCNFIYRNLHNITEIAPTLDSHTALQIFHPPFFVDREGNHPEPYTMISTEDIRMGDGDSTPMLRPDSASRLTTWTASFGTTPKNWPAAISMI
jgi:nicotinamidase-related amidase